MWFAIKCLGIYAILMFLGLRNVHGETFSCLFPMVGCLITKLSEFLTSKNLGASTQGASGEFLFIYLARFFL